MPILPGSIDTTWRTPTYLPILSLAATSMALVAPPPTLAQRMHVCLHSHCRYSRDPTSRCTRTLTGMMDTSTTLRLEVPYTLQSESTTPPCR